MKKKVYNRSKKLKKEKNYQNQKNKPQKKSYN